MSRVLLFRICFPDKLVAGATIGDLEDYVDRALLIKIGATNIAKYGAPEVEVLSNKAFKSCSNCSWDGFAEKAQLRCPTCGAHTLRKSDGKYLVPLMSDEVAWVPLTEQANEHLKAITGMTANLAKSELEFALEKHYNNLLEAMEAIK